MIYIIQGFLYGIAYVAPIGTQNMYVINYALNTNKKRALFCAITTSFWDICLALLCFFGMGYFIEQSQALRLLMLCIGSIMIIYISISIFKKQYDIHYQVEVSTSVKKMIMISFIVTFLNPQAIIDGTLILGGIRATLSTSITHYFIIGTMIASISWFTGLSFIISHHHKHINLNILKMINKIASLILLFYGFKLGYYFIKELNLIF